MVQCGPGMHSHAGYEKCHKISVQHTNPQTQQYHEMALAGKRFENKEEDLGIEEHDNKNPFGLTPEQQERIKANAKIIRQALNKLTRGKFRALFVPLTSILWTYDGMSKKVGQLKAKAKSEKDKKMADAYEKTIEDIVSKVPMLDVENWGEETIPAITQEYRDKVEALKEAIKQKGTRDCIEYAQYRAYRDYLLMADEKQAKIVQRVERERSKTEQALEGTRNVTPKPKRVETGERKKIPAKTKGDKIPSKDEILQKYGFARKVLTPSEEYEQIQQRIEQRKKDEEQKKVDEVGNRTRTSNPYHPSGKSKRR